MLDNTAYARNTIESGLFYLRTLREFCTAIELSFLSNNQNYIDTAKDFGKRYEQLGEIAIRYGKISKLAYDSQIFVTDYTLETELLTEKLFDIDLNTDLTVEEKKVEVGEATEPTMEVLEQLDLLNSNALTLTRNFVEFLKQIYNEIDNNDLFAYLYLDLINYMKNEANLYIRILERTINKESVDPLFVTDYIYRYQLVMRDTAMFLRGLVDPRNSDVFDTFQLFVNTFQKLSSEYKDATISPDVQKQLNTRTSKAVDEYRGFLSTVIQRVLNSEVQFLINPTFLDNVYTEANYFSYLLAFYDNA